MAETFAERVEKLAGLAGYHTPAALAKAAGLSQPATREIWLGISHMEQLQVGTILKLIDTLKTNWTYLLHGIGPSGPGGDAPRARIERGKDRRTGIERRKGNGATGT